MLEDCSRFRATGDNRDATDGTSHLAAVSFEVHWATGIKHFKVRDEATGMAGEFIRNTATRTRDLGGPLGTRAFGAALLKRLGA